MEIKEFTVTIDQFDGPLDLMLHLIKEKQLDLMNLNVSILADQYISYINSMERLHLEIAGEYLSELAGLIEYKSKKLLPEVKSDASEDEEDPRDRLVRRLIEYQQYKEISLQLGDMFSHRQLRMSKPISSEALRLSQTDDDFHFTGNPYTLLKAMQRALMRQQLNRPIETKYTVREVSMEDRELELRAMMDRMPVTFNFESFLQDVHDLPMFIATFLAVLDLARQRKLLFSVDEEDRIWLTRGEALS